MWGSIMIVDNKIKIQNKTRVKKKSSKELIKTVKLWQLQLESLSTPTLKKRNNNYNNELGVTKMHFISQNN